jgi:transcriptional regulator with XRE-family HTH domain
MWSRHRAIGCASGTVSRSDDRRVSPAHEALGRAIRARREAAGMSQAELASRCALHRTYVGGIERGERNVSFSNLLKLAHALDARPSELLAAAERSQVANDADAGR